MTHRMKFSESRKTILIVDDDGGVCRELSFLLSGEGYQILQANNGLEALDALQKCPIDLMISDIYMPGMDGLDLVPQVKLKYPQTSIILISGGGPLNTRDVEHDKFIEGLSNCAQVCLLKKPFAPQAILAEVENALFNS